MRNLPTLHVFAGVATGLVLAAVAYRAQWSRPQNQTGLQSPRVELAERHYRRLFERSQDGILIAASSGSIFAANPAACELLRGTEGDIIRLGRTEVLDFEDPRVSELIAERERLGSSRREVRMRRCDGSSFEAEVSSSGSGDDGIVVIFRDISERKRVLVALRESEARWQFALEGAGDGLWDWNAATDEVFFSRRWKEMLGYAEDEISARLEEWTSRVHPDDLPRVLDELREHLAGNTPAYVSEHRLRCRQGGYKWVLDRGRVISRGEDGGPRRVIGTLHDIAERKAADVALRASEAQLNAIYSHVSTMLVLLDESLVVRRINEAAERFSGWHDTDVDSLELRPGNLIGCQNALASEQGCGHAPACATCHLRQTALDTLHTGATHRRVEIVPRRSGRAGETATTLLASTSRLEVEGRPMVLLCLDDITEQKSLERQFREAQKLEALGQLAGGVAHDFNNILTATLLHVELGRQESGLTAPFAETLRVIDEQSRRAASLTRQLLLFSRREVMQARPLDLNALIDQLLKMVRRILGEHIAVEFQSQPGFAWIEADAGMLDQVVTNLCVNARDAMPRGGRLVLATSSIELTAEMPRTHRDLALGRYVCLEVRDTGCGMDEATRAHIFEPFFTTKEIGKGTGLGLSTVFGIVRQHRGWIDVASAPGRGTTFRIFLPACSNAPTATDDDVRDAALPTGVESILLVEDEAAVRQVTAQLLVNCGYRVSVAANGDEAMQCGADPRAHFDLLLTDMVMPGSYNGLELAESLRETRPEMRVIIVSGYSQEMAGRREPLLDGFQFVPKPCDGPTLMRVVRESLDTRQ